MRIKTPISLLLLLSYLLSFSQEVVAPDYIKSIQCKSTKENTFSAIVPLGAMIHLSFDDLEADEKDYYYKIEHCDENWKSSNLMISEYITGYEKDRIRNYDNSINTLQPYTHYELNIPNENTNIKISGNYLISILDEYDEVIFTRRVVFYEQKATVGVVVYRSRNINEINQKQVVGFTIDYKNLNTNYPEREIHPVILQNDCWQSALKNSKPLFNKGSKLVYRDDITNAFWGGNEFLHFDTKYIRKSTLNIFKSVLGDNLYHTYLFGDKERSESPYSYYPDINGGFVIRTLDRANHNLESDYSVVHFSLDSFEDFTDKDIYVRGSFNNWELNNSNKMKYSEKNDRYELSIPLKQGFYNYQYVTKDKQGNFRDYDISGSFDKTENNYTIIVYYKSFGNRYTRAVGVGYGNSKKIKN